MKNLILFLIFLLTVSFKSHALVLAPIITQELKSICRGHKPNSKLAHQISNLNLSTKRCDGIARPRDNSNKQSVQVLKGSPQALHLHLPRLDVIEEEDDFFNDDLYMWFVITRDGIPTIKVTKIYKGLDEGQSLIFDHEDRVISNLPFYQHMIVDFGIVESDGDDIREMQRLSRSALDLVVTALGQLDPDIRASLSQELREEVTKVMELLIGLDHDDRLVTGSLLVDFRDTWQVWQNNRILERPHEFQGTHLGSDFKYRLTWRYLLVDFAPSALFLGAK